MKFWVKIVAAVLGFGILAIVGGFFLGQFVPGLSSSLAQSLSIFILSIGITGSSIAVLSGRSLEEYYKKQDQEKRVKSAFVSYLSKVYYQIVAVGNTYGMIPKLYGMPPPDLSNPALMASYTEFALDPYLQSEAKDLLDAKPIDTSYYRENVEDHLLFMTPDLAMQASSVDALIYLLNDYYADLSNRINKELPFPKPMLTRLPPHGYIIHANLHTHRNMYQLLSELALGLRDHVFALRKNILNDTTDLPSLRLLFDKEGAIRVALEEENKDFLKMLFPPQTSK